MPFKAGHTVNENEAHALNQVLAENVRNNLAGDFKEAKEEAAKNGTELDVKALQRMTDLYIKGDGKEDKGYEFGVRTGGVRVADPVEAAALEFARGLVRKNITQTGGKLKDFSRAQITERAEKLLEKNPKIRELAKSQVEAAKALEASVKVA
jgi:hypothetical protein